MYKPKRWRHYLVTDLCFQTKFEDGSGYWHKVFHSPVEKPDNQGGRDKINTDTDHHFLSRGGTGWCQYWRWLWVDSFNLSCHLTHHKLYFLSITFMLPNQRWTKFYECKGTRPHHPVCGHCGTSHRGRRSPKSKVCLTFSQPIICRTSFASQPNF